MNPPLQNKVALVTGSSRGIGEAIANALKQSGAKVIRHGDQPMTSKNSELYVEQNLLEPGAGAAAFRQALKLDAEIDVLIANAGSVFDVPFLEMTPERWHKTMDLNVRETYFLIQAFARHRVSLRKPGAVVITTSINGFQAEMHSTAYDVSKGALVMMIRSLALNLGHENIRVNGIAPGLIRTQASTPFLSQAGIVAHYEKKIVLGRIGTPEDCAGAAVFLCSDAARYITGEIITVDGGLTIGQIGRLE